MQELKRKSTWLVWKYETSEDGKKKKIPMKPYGLGRCGTDAKFTKDWTVFSKAAEARAERHMEGVGFVIPKGYGVVDIDHMDDRQPYVKGAFELFPSYCEKSPSGQGVHIIFKVDPDKIPFADGKFDKSTYYMKNPHTGVEIYLGGFTNRYMTFTENAVNELPVVDCTEGYLQYIESFMRKDSRKSDGPEKKGNFQKNDNSQMTKSITSAVAAGFLDEDAEYEKFLSDEEILAIARNAKNSEKFIALHDKGDYEEYYSSQSEADLAECSMLAFYSGGNPETMDRIHRKGRLYREKWEREDYRKMTIHKAIEGCRGTFYRPRPKFPEFIGFKKDGKLCIICPKLAEHFRKNQYMLSVRDGVKGTVQRYLYENGCYRLYADEMIKGIIKSYIEAFDPNLLKMRDVNEVFQQLATDLNFVRSDQLNTNEHLINFQNGLLDIRTLELFKHDPSVVSTIQIPCDWKGCEVPTPVFDAFMDRLLDGKEAEKKLLMEFMGICISNIKGWRMKKALFMVGKGNTGKSQLKSLTEKMLGKGNYTSLELNELEARFGTGNIYGKRLAGSSDMEFMTVRELKTFKKITGGDSLFAEFKGENGFEFVYDGLLWFCMNELPRFGGDDGQWVYDRIMQINCNNVIPEEEQDKFLQDKMFEEREGIIYKLVMAAREVIDNGYRFHEPESMKEDRDNYKKTNNTVLAFWEECMRHRNGEPIYDRCTTGRIYKVYKAWCRDANNGYPKTTHQFREIISAHLREPYADLLQRCKYGSVFLDYTLKASVKENYRKEYGDDDGYEDIRREFEKAEERDELQKVAAGLQKNTGTATITKSYK